MNPEGLPTSDIEKIAAFLDRRLPEEERREFLERLDTDEALYEVFVETVRYREQSAQETSNVIEHPASKRWSRWLGPAAMAAALALVVAGPLVLRDAGGPSDFAVALVRGEGFEGSLESGWTEQNRWYDQGWTVFRGFEPSGEELEATFRAGVRSLEVEVALRTGRRDEARELVEGLRHELGKIELFNYEAFYDDVLRQLEEEAEPPVSTDEVLRQFLEIDAEVSKSFALDSSSYTFGKWTETGRLAAHSANRDLLSSSLFRDTLDQVREETWKPPIEQRLDAIAEKLDAPSDALDLDGLQRDFQGIIDSH